MKNYNPDIHKRRSVRLKDFDYSREGLYFITICCQNKEHFFGKITNDEMILNEIGKVVEKCWLEIPQHFPNVALHAYTIMPNHIHGIIEITQNAGMDVGANKYSPYANDSPNENISTENDVSENKNGTNCERAKDFSPLRSPSKTIGSIVRGFKIGVTKWVRTNTEIYKIWQRNYHEHIIRNDFSYMKITEYIQNNPKKWEKDCFWS